ncbi:CpsD/CapB family tyrosine-protein kinase [Pseudonocardia halophobica]|uniref:CpsD/CapB family tyrosine-protein kinase n=1 Tax=Pseudonocardia halophobica TaxID=29401 RepID=UPI003D8A7BDA
MTLEARLAGASPIIYVEATSSDRAAAESAASTVAAAFRTDVNANREAAKQGTIDLTHKEIDTQLALLKTLPPGSSAASSITAAIGYLQGRISDIQADTSNQLQDLQLDAGVSSTKPSLLINAALGLIGGLILGCLAALVVAGVRDRLTSPAEVTERTGLTPLAEIRAGDAVAMRQSRVQALQRLANFLTRAGSAKPMIVAVTAPHATEGVAQVAFGLASLRATQGDRVLLMRTDLHRHDDADPGRPGVSDVLDGRAGELERMTVAGSNPNLHILPAGVAMSDPFELFTPARVEALVTQARGGVDLVIVETAPILDAAEAQTVCAASDATLLVVEAGKTKAGDATQASALLDDVGVAPLGAVLVADGVDLPTATEPERPIDDGTSAADPEATCRLPRTGAYEHADDEHVGKKLSALVRVGHVLRR